MSGTLKYCLRPIAFNENDNSLYAQFLDVPHVTEEEFEALIAARLKGKVPPEQIKEVVSAIGLTASELIAEGKSFRTILCSYDFSPKGKFKTPNDSWDRGKHSVSVNCTPSKALQKATEELHFEKVPTPHVGPDNIYVCDSIERSLDPFTVRKKHVMEVTGNEIGISDNGHDSTDQGAYLVGSDGLKQKCPDIILNTRSKIIVTLPPDLAIGTYKILIRTYKYKSNVRTNCLEGVSDKTVSIIE